MTDSSTGSIRQRGPHRLARPQLIDLEAELERAADGRAGRAPTQIMNLADYECRHGRLPGDPTPPCGCFANERPTDEPILAPPSQSADVVELRPRASRRSLRPSLRDVS
jgi:hypothetical protein